MYVNEPTLRARRELRSIAVRVCEREAERLESIAHTPIYKKEPPTLSDEECAAILASWIAKQDSETARRPSVDPTKPVRSVRDERKHEQLLLLSRIAFNRFYLLDAIAKTRIRTPQGNVAFGPITAADHERIELQKDRCRERIRTLSERLAILEPSEIVVSQRAQMVWRFLEDRIQRLALDSCIESELKRGKCFLQSSIEEKQVNTSKLAHLANELESAIRTWKNRTLPIPAISWTSGMSTP